MIKGNEVAFINGLTAEYFDQFQDIFRTQRREGTAKDYMDDIWIDAGAPCYRLKKVLEKRPREWLSIIAHDECMPKDVGQPQYYIELERIKTPEKALAWSFQLKRKRSFNPKGWLCTLEGLFGNISINKD